MIHEPIVVQPELATDRFVLRPLRQPDTGLIAFYTADKRIADGTRTIPHPLPPGATEAFVARILADAGKEDIWIIDGSGLGHAEVIGLVSLARMERDQSEVKYWVAPAFWNTGYASQAVAAIVAANPQGARTLFAEVFQDNPGSARVLTNCGFDYLGDAEAYSVARNATVPTWTYLRAMG
ncbi:MAG: GNAT family N-acetyltransferase [Albidovulum sp.]